jgi:hypothetical protein
MGIVKQDFMNVRLSAEIDEQEWNEIPNEYRDMFNVKRIEVIEIGGKPAKETYKQCPTWKRLNDEMIEALKKRQEREEQIRVDLRNES